MSGQFRAPAVILPGKESLGGPQSGSEHSSEDKNPSPCRESNPGIPIVQPVAPTDAKIVCE
jgi:pyruvate/2-oxoglutarate/acetoin dehydrogenase E1 component